MRLITLCAALSLSMNSIAGALHHPLVVSFPDSKRFDHVSKQYDKVDLVAGAIEYQVAKDDEGYYAQQLLRVQGQVSSYVNDFSDRYSAVHIFEEMQEKLDDMQFELLYQCSAEQCGDLSAWRLMLSEHVWGDESSQHYLLAKQAGANGNQWFLQFYVVNLDNEPRSYMRIVNASERSALSLVLNEDVLNIHADRLPDDIIELANIPPVLFDSNSATLQPQAKDYLDKVASELTQHEVSEFMVVGHADSRGSSVYNFDLAKARANAVLQALQAYPELADIKMTVKSLGEAKPVADNTTKEGRQQNRRVVLVTESAVQAQ